MKKIIERLRRWTIKKLGGYVEKEMVKNIAPFEAYTTMIVRVEKSVSVHEDVFVGKLDSYARDNFMEFKREELTRHLMKELLDRGLVRFQKRENKLLGEVVIKATVSVVETPEGV